MWSRHGDPQRTIGGPVHRHGIHRVRRRTCQPERRRSRPSPSPVRSDVSPPSAISGNGVAVRGSSAGAGSGIVGGPITYSVDGKQYVAVSTGPSLVAGGVASLTPEFKPATSNQMFVFALP